MVGHATPQPKCCLPQFDLDQAPYHKVACLLAPYALRAKALLFSSRRLPKPRCIRPRTKSRDTHSMSNPLLAAWQTPFETPPFDDIRSEHFLPAFEQGFTEHIAEIDAIVTDRAEPTFDNTITALERSGKLLTKVSSVFYALVGAHSNPELLA